MGDTMVAMDTDDCITVRSLDDVANLRASQLDSSSYWWPEIGPHDGTGSFSLTLRQSA
jgi:hypothetical protein